MIKRIFKHVFRFAIYSWDLEFSVKLKKNGLRKHVVRTTLVVIPLALASLVVVSELTPPHSFTVAECFNCHFTVPGEGDPRPYRFVAPISTLCTGCHQDLSPVSHYVNALTDETYDMSFPVVEADGINCATCHDPHLTAADPATGEKTYFLRGGVKGKAQCLLCHTEAMPSQYMFTLLPVMDTAHGVAHFTVLGDVTLDYTNRHLAGVRDGLVTLDPLSVYCLGCHDDPANPELTMPGSELYMHGSDNGMSHPVGISYDAAAWNNPELKRFDMDPRVLLFDGRIGCCTCHDPYTPGVSVGLRIGGKTDYTELCKACHIR